MALITDPAEYNDWLRELIAHIHWDEFSKLNNGTIEVSSIPFKLRVGLHMNRPTRAIIAMGQFVRVKAAPEFKVYSLKKLTADAPDICLYWKGGSNGASKPCWSPGGFVEEPEQDKNFCDSLILDYATHVNQMMARPKCEAENERRNCDR